MYCRKCGTLIDDKAAFCYKCGEKVIVETDNNNSKSIKNAEEIKEQKTVESLSSKPKLIVVAAGVLIAAVAAVCFFVFSHNGKPVLPPELDTTIKACWGDSIEKVKKNHPQIRETSKSNRKFKELRTFELNKFEGDAFEKELTKVDFSFYKDQLYRVSYSFHRDRKPPVPTTNDYEEHHRIMRKWYNDCKDEGLRIDMLKKVFRADIKKLLGEPVKSVENQKDIIGIYDSHIWHKDGQDIELRYFNLSKDGPMPSLRINTRDQKLVDDVKKYIQDINAKKKKQTK